MTVASIPPRRRPRRRFRYRKQAWCLLASFFVLGLGANLLIMVRIWMFTEQTEPRAHETFGSTRLSSSHATSNHSSSSKFRVSDYLSLLTKIFGWAVSVVILFQWLRKLASALVIRGLEPSHLWQALVLAPIALAVDSVREFVQWCRGDYTPEARAPRLQRPAMTVTETLQAFNRQRVARGESTVSTESIEAYERFLRDLASSMVDGGTVAAIGANTTTIRQGLSKAQLEDSCPCWTILEEGHERHHFLSQTECGICLEAYSEQNSTTCRTIQLRTLPCKHTFHADCIDQWLNRSVSCPTCKDSVVPISQDKRSIHENAFLL